jgi:hypothetical protein
MHNRVLHVGMITSVLAFPFVAVAQQGGAPAAQGPAPAEYRPSIADMMNIGIQPRHIKIGLALKEQNWDYLTYEVNELKGAFTRVVRTIPRINNRYDSAELIQAMIASPIDELADGVKAKDLAKSAAAYAAVTAGCNTCHQAVAHRMIVIKSPQAEFFPDQEFRSAQ